MIHTCITSHPRFKNVFCYKSQMIYSLAVISQLPASVLANMARQSARILFLVFSLSQKSHLLGSE